jgi:hypothetical protein
LPGGSKPIFRQISFHGDLNALVFFLPLKRTYQLGKEEGLFRGVCRGLGEAVGVVSFLGGWPFPLTSEKLKKLVAPTIFSERLDFATSSAKPPRTLWNLSDHKLYCQDNSRFPR